MKRMRIWGLSLAVLFTLLSFGVVLAQDKTLYWQRYDVNIDIQSNGDFVVTEEQEIAFTSGTFQFGFAAIPLARLDSITDISVSEVAGGQESPYKQSASHGANTFQTYEENKQQMIYWYFSPTTNATRTYRLKYKVLGGMRYYDKGDQLWWKAIAPDHNFPIKSSTITVNLPADFEASQLVIDSYGASAQNSITGSRTVSFNAKNISSDKELEVRVQFPHGVMSGQSSAWQAAFDRQQTLGPIINIVMLLFGALILIGGLAGLYLFWYSRGRDKPVKLVSDYLTEPPSTVSPGVAGALVDEEADMQDILATLLDLGDKGALRIEEKKNEGILGIGSGVEHTFILLDRSKATKVFELTLIDGIFGKGDRKKLTDLRDKFYTFVPKLKNQLYDELVKEGFFTASPQKERNKWIGIGFVGLIIAAVLFCVLTPLLSDYSSLGFCPSAALGVVAIAMMIAGRYMPRKTDKGAQATAEWLAFKNYLKNMENYTNLEEAKEIYQHYLAYAVAFGIDRDFINKFARIDAPAPAWYAPVFFPIGNYQNRPMANSETAGGPIAGAFPTMAKQQHTSPGELAGEGGMPSLAGASSSMSSSLAGLSAGLTGMLSSASSTFTSQPAPKSSGGSSGGGGWSGGGGFGGGGGGGGSRGFG
jgi:uncharacterized membrane protein